MRTSIEMVVRPLPLEGKVTRHLPMAVVVVVERHQQPEGKVAEEGPADLAQVLQLQARDWRRRSF